VGGFTRRLVSGELKKGAGECGEPEREEVRSESKAVHARRLKGGRQIVKKRGNSIQLRTEGHWETSGHNEGGF